MRYFGLWLHRWTVGRVGDAQIQCMTIKCRMAFVSQFKPTLLDPLAMPLRNVGV